MAASPARACAYRVLRRVDSEGSFADRAFRGEADRAGLDARDRAFAQRLAYGAIQRRRTIDHVVEALATREPDPPVLDALRLGVFQLVWMDSVPDRAAVDQTVELVKEASPRAAGFANAVMRRAGREARALVERLPPESAAALSHPDWLAEMWTAMLGPEEAAALMRADNEPAESAIRANELVTTREELLAALAERGVEARPAAELPEGVVVDGPFDAHGSDLFEEGLVMPQSRGSMAVARALDPRPGERVLDMCAAPGAKSTHLAALMRDEGAVVAVEANAARARELEVNARRLRAGAVAVHHADARTVIEHQGFDRVLLDAPCSDLGTLQSRPDARWRKGPAQIAELTALQRELLAAAVPQLRPGGTLVYSVCTISPAEGAEQVDWLLSSFPELRPDGDPVQLLPHRDGTDGFFIARVRG
ncbi:MAG: rRNA (cytosine967-C5)-methyltransferase [Thermoleophilaceae bacterium]|nr:rRNA (cytosine967-C5)-methyltransferase [Thermoleophilaceae bacterium]MEA2350731.1 rRNA (cytosine967-C5)-methyltransferase [Thermoleophilaceae bacterium]